MTDEPTTVDCAERARMVWEMYRDLHGDEIHFLIADLMHLADVDEHPGGGVLAVREAMAHYADEQPIWPAEPTAPRYLAQFRPKGEDWITAATGDETVELREVASSMWRLMETHGFRPAEITLHLDDLVRGDVLTAEDGTEFRAIENPQA